MQAHAEQLFGAIRVGLVADEEDHETIAGLLANVDGLALKGSTRQVAERVSDLVINNALSIGISRSIAHLLAIMHTSLEGRRQELEVQREMFWSSHGRPPDHYARTIALRFAKWTARTTLEKPTFGTASDGDHPSTNFGRCLEEIFALLDIQTNVKYPALWAIDQLTEADWTPEPKNALASLGGDLFSPPHQDNALSTYAKSLAKGTGE